MTTASPLRLGRIVSLVSLLSLLVQCGGGSGGGLGPNGTYDINLYNGLVVTSAHLVNDLPNPGETPVAGNLVAAGKGRVIHLTSTRPSNGDSFEFKAYIPPDLVNPVATVDCFVTANGWVSSTPYVTLTASGQPPTYTLTCTGF